jgi:hypothetical protein
MDARAATSPTGDNGMRYMMLIYTQEAPGAMTEQEVEDLKQRHAAVIEETARLGIFRGAEPLQPTSVATTLRVQDGQVLATDGPFAETKEQLAGYYILDCKDLDEAIYWGSRIPTACGGRKGSLEIRPIQEMTSRAIAEMADKELSASSRG